MHIQRILKIAMQKEKKAHKAYMAAASLARDAVDKVLLRSLALEEKKHEKILRNQINLANEISKDKVFKLKKEAKYSDIKLKAAEDLAKVYFKANKELQKLNIELEEEERAAALIQRNLIPKACPHVKDLQVSAISHMARRIGGDFFDFRQDEPGLSLVIADIMGKGLPSSLLMSSLRASWKSFVSLHYKPSRIVAHINNVTYEDFNLNQSFASFISAYYDSNAHVLHFCNAGNEPPLYFNSRTQKISFLRSREILIGVNRSFKYKGRSLKFNSGDIVIFFTDGLPQYMPLREVKKIVAQNREKSAQEILALITAKPMENLKDDTSLIIMKRI